MDMQATKPEVKAAPKPENEKFPYYRGRDIFHAHKNGRPAATAIVSEADKIAYVPVPKNACTSLKALFYEILNQKKAPNDQRQIHNAFGRPEINFKRFAADKDYFKFLIVRDPIERFISAYNNRVLWHNELSEGWMKDNRRHEVAAFEKKSLTYNPNINEFARRLEEYIEVSQAIRHHFIWQRRFFFNRPQAFDKVYTIRELPELIKDLSERLGRQLVLPNTQETKNMKSAARLSDLGSKELSHVIQYYVEDYQTLRPYLN